MKDRFRKGDNDNVLFVTSRCSNRCIMCCQPPSVDSNYATLFSHNMQLIECAAPDTDEICITGGEPTLIGDDLFQYMEKIWECLPNTTIQLLSNGRAFASIPYLSDFISHIKGKIYFGVPVHSDNPVDHDLIAGAHNSFYQTIEGLQNLGKLRYDIEIRIILLKQNVDRLPQIANFIVMNLPFVSQVSFMGLEIIGNAYNNYPDIIEKPSCFAASLSKAISVLDNCKIKPRIFNLPLCLIPENLWIYTCRSISQWKIKYTKQCNSCVVKQNCCGLFSTSKIEWDNITPLHF